MNLILGAIAGDIAGEPYEFGNNRNPDAPLFTPQSTFTDDTILTVAVMKICLSNDFSTENIADTMADFARRYPSSYGVRFRQWILDKTPYGSLGNGAAMRISPVYYLKKTLSEKIEIAERITNVSHNHEESIKWVTALVRLAEHLQTDRNFDIRGFMKNEYGTNLTNVKYLRENYEYSEKIQNTVPESITILNDSKNFSDVLKNSISIGGDADTIAAIAGGVAEIIYPIDTEIKEKVFRKLPEEFKKIVREFSEALATMRL